MEKLKNFKFILLIIISFLVSAKLGQCIIIVFHTSPFYLALSCLVFILLVCLFDTLRGRPKKCLQN